jgi:hypothetical protein
MKKKNQYAWIVTAGVVLLCIISFVILSKKPELKELNLADCIKILEANSDYKEYKDNFYNQFGRYPEFSIIENVKMDKIYISQKLAELNSTPYSMVYENLPDSDYLYLVRLQEKNETKRGLISVIDVQKHEVVKIFALLDINLG